MELLILNKFTYLYQVRVGIVIRCMYLYKEQSGLCMRLDCVCVWIVDLDNNVTWKCGTILHRAPSLFTDTVVIPYAL